MSPRRFVEDPWQCPKCERRFARRNARHECGPPADLAAHFAGRDASVLQLYRALLALAQRSGPVTVVPDRMRISFRARAPFLAIAPRQMHLIGHFVFGRRIPSPRFQKIETMASGLHAHHFCLERPDELDDEFQGWIREAYEAGLREPPEEKRGKP